MDLEKLNKDYQGAKKDKLYASLDAMEKRLEKLEKDLIAQKRQGEDAQTKKARAQEDKDEAKIKQAEQEIKDAKEAMEKTKKQIEKQKETITKTKGKVEKYIDEIAKDPEMKAQIDKMIAGRCKKEVKRIEDEKQKVANFQELLKKHPNVEANVVGMINAIDNEKWLILEKQKIENKINSGTIKDPNEILKLNAELGIINTQIDTAATKYETNQSLILKCAEKSNIDVSKEWLKEFFRYGSDTIAHNKDTKDKDGNIVKGKLNINKTLNNKIKTYDKQLKPYKTTMMNLGMIQEQEDIRRQAESEGQQNDQPIMRDHEGANSQDSQGTNLPATTEKPKFNWKHPFKSIKAIMEYNKAQYIDLGYVGEQGQQGDQQQDAPQQDEPEQQTNEQAAREKAERNQKNREFRKALHYDVVNDYVNKRMEDLQKEDFREAEPTAQNNANDQQNENEQNSDNAR